MEGRLLSGFALAWAVPLALSVLPRQDSEGGGVSDVGGAPWHTVLGQCGLSLSRGVTLCELYRNCEIFQFKTVLGVHGPCLFPCMAQRLHLYSQKSFPLTGDYPCINN